MLFLFEIVWFGRSRSKYSAPTAAALASVAPGVKIFPSIIVKQAEVDRVTDLINHRPRKSLDYRTPHEVRSNHSGIGAVQT